MNRYRGKPHAYTNTRASSGPLQGELERRAVKGEKSPAAVELRAENQRRHNLSVEHWPSAYC